VSLAKSTNTSEAAAYLLRCASRWEASWEKLVSQSRGAANRSANVQLKSIRFLGGWRWVAALIAIFSGLLTFVGSVLTPETYAPVLLNRRAALLSKVTGKVYRYKGAAKKVEPSQLFKSALSKPWILLFREPIVLLLST